MDTNLNQFLTNIADAIRSKKGTTEKINAQDFVQEIESIESSSVVATNGVPILIESEEQYNELLNSPETEDLDKIYDYNGQLLKLYSSDTTEERTLEIDKNGEYSVVQYDKVNVNQQDMLQTLINTNKRTYYLFSKYIGNDFEAFKNLDFSEVTEMSYMFNEMRDVTSPTIIDIDFSTATKVTKMISMFSGCERITKITSQLNTSLVTDMSSMFRSCYKLTSIPQLDTSSVTSMNYMFSGCKSLTTIPQLDTSSVTSMRYMLQNCKALSTIPQLDTSSVTDMRAMFSGCNSLTEIPPLDTSLVTVMSSMFGGCISLKSILMYGMKVSFDISKSTQFEREDLVTIINNLATVETSQTLTMGSTNLMKLTEDDIINANAKNWTLA